MAPGQPPAGAAGTAAGNGICRRVLSIMIDKKMSIIEIEEVYDLIAAGIDKAGPDKTALFLAKLSLALANLVGDSQAVANAVLAAGRDL